MEKNYTPLDTKKFSKNNDQTMTFLLLLAVITLFILAVVLFLFIQKKINENNLPIAPTPTEIQPSPLPTFEPTPTEEVFRPVEPSASPGATITESTNSPLTEEAAPREEATQSAQ
jgi:hypothetical protein